MEEQSVLVDSSCGIETPSLKPFLGQYSLIQQYQAKMDDEVIQSRSIHKNLMNFRRQHRWRFCGWMCSTCRKNVYFGFDMDTDNPERVPAHKCISANGSLQTFLMLEPKNRIPSLGGWQKKLFFVLDHRSMCHWCGTMLEQNVDSAQFWQRMFINRWLFWRLITFLFKIMCKWSRLWLSQYSITKSKLKGL